MRRLSTIVLSGLALLLGACAGSSSSDDATSEDDLAKRTHRYVDISPDKPLTGIPRDKILRALAKLDRMANESKSPLRRALAGETLARIESGDVLLGSIEASRGIDRWHMCKDEGAHACDGAPPAPDDRTFLGDAALAKKLEDDLLGYQWGNRLYFTLSSETDVTELAATLVHETVHVANRSECNYYKVIDKHTVNPDAAYVEELRSFLSDCFVTEESGTVASCTKYAAERVDEYGFSAKLSRILPDKTSDPEKLTNLILASEPDGPAQFGRIVPRKKYWPSSFNGCPTR